jgi:hypothetical protein
MLPPSFTFIKEDGWTSCDLRGMHGSVGAVAAGDGEHCSMFRSDIWTERVAEPSTDRAMRFFTRRSQLSTILTVLLPSLLVASVGMAPMSLPLRPWTIHN